MSKALYDSNSVMYILGALLRQPSKIIDGSYILTEADFFGIHRILFTTIFQLASEGFTKITPQNIDLQLKQYPLKYAEYQKESGYEYLVNIFSLIHEVLEKTQFDYHYERIKKFTVLRELNQIGIDTKFIFDPDLDILKLEKQNQEFNALEVSDIIRMVNGKVIGVEEKNIVKNAKTTRTAGELLDELLVELKEGAGVGFPLDGHLLNAVSQGARLKRLYLYSAPTGHGKALVDNDIIPTFYDGKKYIKDIKVGDYLIGRDGKPTKVLGVYPQGELDVYKITFQDGRTALSSADHLWNVVENDGDEKTLTLQEIIDKMGNSRKFKIPINKAVEREAKEYPVDPYFMGVGLRMNSFQGAIPDFYKNGSIEQRVSLLYGLLGGDACIENKVLYTSNKQFKDDFMEILWTLGWTASVVFNGVYKIKIHEYTGFNPITNIEKLNKQEPMRCFAVDNEDKLFLMKDYIVTHNTRFFVGNACSLSMPYIENGEVIIKDDLTKVVFIATEMDPDEIQTLILAYISGVNEEKILNHTYNSEEANLVKNAIKLMKEYSDNFVIEKISDPNISTLKVKVLDYVINKQVHHIFYDYIFMSPALSTEFRSGQRDDVSLMMMANTLKEIASDYDVFVYTGTQVNREWEKRHFRNENIIAGSKAIADKIDLGIVAIKAEEEEREKIRDLLRADGIREDPNLVLDVYKNRRSRFVNVKIYRVFDYGTCRTRDLMITDTNYNKIQGINVFSYTHKKRGLLDLAVDKNV